MSNIKFAIFTNGVGYFLILASVAVLSILIKIFTGYYPSIPFFILSLISMRLSEVHFLFNFVPFFISVTISSLLLRNSERELLPAGISLCSYYVLTALIITLSGGEMPPFIILWIIWIFVIGILSARITRFLTLYFKFNFNFKFKF